MHTYLVTLCDEDPYLTKFQLVMRSDYCPTIAIMQAMDKYEHLVEKKLGLDNIDMLKTSLITSLNIKEI